MQDQMLRSHQMTRKYHPQQHQSSILKNAYPHAPNDYTFNESAIGSVTPQTLLNHKKKVVKQRTASQDSSHQDRHRSRSKSQKKSTKKSHSSHKKSQRSNSKSKSCQSKSKGQSKSVGKCNKRQIRTSRVPLEITILRGDHSNPRLNVTAYVPSQRNANKQSTRKASLSASNKSKNRRVNIRQSITDQSDDTGSNHSSQIQYGRLLPKNIRKHSGRNDSKTMNERQISQEFQISETQSKRNQSYLETHEELNKTRSQLKHYRQVIDDLKNQLEIIDTLKTRIKEEHTRSNILISKSEKYKALAKQYRNQLDQIKQTLESEKTQKCIAIEREQSRIRINNTLRKQQGLIINEIVLSLQRFQMHIRDIDESGQMSKQVNEIFGLLGTFHNITVQSKNVSYDQTFSECTNDQQLQSNFVSEKNGCNSNISDMNFMNTERVDYFENPCSQTQFLSYSIFSPKFMVSSERGGKIVNHEQKNQSFSNHHTSQKQLQQTTQQFESSSAAIENFTLTYDPQQANILSSHNQTQTTNQSGLDQLDLLLKVQQEMQNMKEQQDRLIEENRMLKDMNKEARREQEAVGSELKQHIRRIERDNHDLRDERDSYMVQVEQIQKQAKDSIITMLLKKSNSNSTNRSNDDTMDLQQYIESKKSLTIINPNLSQSDQNNSLITYQQPYILTQDNQTTSMNQRKSQSSLESLSQSLNRSRSVKATGLPIRSNSKSSVQLIAEQNNNNQRSHDLDRDQLFSLSSTHPDNLQNQVRVENTQNKENMAPRLLDFNHYSQVNAIPATFQLLKPEIINHNESCQTQKPPKSNMIKIEETIGFSQEATNRLANSSFERSTAAHHSTNKIPILLDQTRIYTQESDKLPGGNEIRSSDRNFSRTNYQQLNYNDSEKSFDRHRYSNYDSKNITQQVPPMIMMSQQNHSQESLSQPVNLPAILSYNASQDQQLFSKLTTSKNTSRKNLHHDISSSQMLLRKQDSSDNKNLNCENMNPNMANNTNASSSQMLNQTGCLSQIISTQGDQPVNDERQNTVTSHLSASVRTLNLKKEISTLDQEILLLQKNLKDALHKRPADMVA